MTDKKPVSQEGPIELFATAMMTGSGGDAVLHQEARGQASLVNSDTLPIRVDIYSSGYDPKAVLTSWGIKLLDPVEGDPLFLYVELPAGWKKQPTDHSMWSNLVDDKGRDRASIFYKAAFYDRDAFMNLKRRYALAYDYEKEQCEGVAVTNVIDGSKIIFSTDPVALPDRKEERESHNSIRESAQQTAIAWLKGHFPDWQDLKAYWD